MADLRRRRCSRLLIDFASRHDSDKKMRKTNPRQTPFDTFCSQRKKDLQRITRHSHGEHELSDVRAEAWLMAKNMRNTKGIEIDWLDPKDQDLLLSYLYQQLVRYTDLHFRYAVRLDHRHDDDKEDEPHPLLSKLAASELSDPLAALLVREEAARAEIEEPNCHHSLASAYVHLLRQFDNRMSAVAEHLLISLSYCYARYARVRLCAERQHPIPMHQIGSHRHFVPGAWRSFRLRRTPVQLAFDFDAEQPLAFMSK
ncbi:MAG: hypothetical protein ACTHKB_13780 [Burkholderiaceae bacterium]